MKRSRWALILLDCAWILWRAAFAGDRAVPVDEFPTKAACEVVRDQKRGGGDILALTSPVVYTCLPDSIDPRDPKR
jgi:hypothetical protein